MLFMIKRTTNMLSHITKFNIRSELENILTNLSWIKYLEILSIISVENSIPWNEMNEKPFQKNEESLETSLEVFPRALDAAYNISQVSFSFGKRTLAWKIVLRFNLYCLRFLC